MHVVRDYGDVPRVNQHHAADFPHLTWGNFFMNNLIPVTIGNIIGGAIMVGRVYWFVYIRKTD